MGESMNEREQAFIADEHTLYFVCSACGKRINVMLWGDKEQGVHVRVLSC